LKSTSSSILLSHIALICSSLLVFLMTVAVLCGGNTLACISVITTDGVIALGWLTGATAIGAVLLRRFKLQPNRALFISTAGGLGLGIYSLLGLGFGLLGWLNRPIAIAFPAVSLLLFVADLFARHSTKKQFDRSTLEDWLRAPAGFSWIWLIPVVSLAIAAVSASLMPGILWKPLDPHPYDVTSYHLLVPREWYEGGRIIPLAHNVFSYFTFNVEMQFLLLMHATGGPWAGMYACQFLCLGYAALMVVGVFGAGDQQGTPVIAAAIASTIPWVIMLAGVAYVESALMLYTVLAIAWALHALANPQHFTRSAILAGMMAGLACGVKITAVPMLLLAVPTALLAAMFIRKPSGLSVRKFIFSCVLLGTTGLVLLSPWLIRNLIWSGNPLFPVEMKRLGQDHFSNEQVVRFDTEHTPTFPQKPISKRLKVLGKDVIAHQQYGWLLLPAGLIALALRRRSGETAVLAVCGMFVLVSWVGFTHTLPRFLVMLIPVAAIAIGRIEWGRAWPGAIVLLLVSAGIGWSFVIPELCKQSDPPSTPGQPGIALFGPTKLDFMMPEELINAYNLNPHLQVALIGDAQAFFYQIPMSQLHYRSVFNVSTGTNDPIDAWIGPQVRGDRNWFLVVNPMEIERLHRTYVGIPALPKEWEPDPENPRDFFLRGDQVPTK
jgi:hypothetical protein